MNIYIKNMVSLRCKMMVKFEMKKLGLRYVSVELGEVELESPISKSDRKALKVELKKSGLIVMDDKNAMLIEKIINIIVETVHYSEEEPKENFSTILSKQLDKSYSKLALIFSKTKGITIEQFMILHKVERIKELIIYDELNITEIAFKMHYSSVAHLSNQFKSVTGLTPSFFKRMIKRNRKNLEDL
ncbi:MAG: AraC family transcriptional regulator [Flavobacteriales bacterium]|nr:MAG: AraC family transcriptional regulator [Flavobacteriales bacterium]